MSERIDLSTYRLLFNEEFDSLRLLGEDGGLWKTEGYWGARNLYGNGEKQLYVDPAYEGLGLNPFNVQDGVLTIRAEPTAPDLKPQLQNKDYTSGMIASEQSFSMQYGYYEMRAQLPEGKGLWSCFWLMGLDGQWPPELDVVEVLGQKPDKLYGTHHYIDSNGKRKIDYAVGVEGMFDSSDGFHTYGMDWQADKITWYYDGVKVGEVSNQTYDQAVYMIANLTVGGYWPGSPDATTPWPADMKIDYIRAYQKAPDHAVVGIPDQWAPMGLEAFTAVDVHGFKSVPFWDYDASAQESKLALAGDKSRFLTGNDADNFLAGSDTTYNELVGGKGNDTLYGAGGADIFVIRNGDGNDTILDLTNTVGNTDKIRLEGFHFRHADDVLPWLQQVGNDVILRLDEDQALLLKDKDVAQLTPDMFIFTDPVIAPAGARVLSAEQIAPAPPIDAALVPAPPVQAPAGGMTLIGPGTTEAELLTLSGGYAAEASTQASAGTFIKATGSGQASGLFGGEAGTYRVDVGFLDEHDGVSSFALMVNDRIVGLWAGTSEEEMLDSQSFQTALNPGDVLTISGSQGRWEHARVDWFSIVPVPVPVADPAPVPAEPAADQVQLIGSAPDGGGGLAGGPI